MLTLCGFPISNYYNKVKLVLLEKGLPFEEQLVMTRSTDEAVLACSPLGKVPFLRTPQGALCESQVINDWLEAAYPEPALVPSDPFEAAKVRELATFVDLHLELVARELYPQAFFGGTVDEATKTRARKLLTRHIAGFQRLARFAPYVAGERFTLADASAFVSLPLVALATKIVLGEDMLAAAGVDWKGYVKLVGDRPSAQRVVADRKAAEAAMAAKAQAKT
ncbi:MAG: glutathione S-transferase [Burkholderiaceae bacterium]|nr:glutathione S-transferase [Burkholderiaceae bacterium]